MAMKHASTCHGAALGGRSVLVDIWQYLTSAKWHHWRRRIRPVCYEGENGKRNVVRNFCPDLKGVGKSRKHPDLSLNATISILRLLTAELD